MTEPADNDLSRARRSLDDAIVLVRNREADRQDVVVDMADAEYQRLELLLEELIDIRESLRSRGQAAERFDFAISHGARPRLWIDPVAWVQMGSDRRTYRFLRDNAAGRALIAESGDIDLVASTVTDYVAERIVERERRVETEYVLPDAGSQAAAAPTVKPKRGFWRTVLSFVVSFLLGAVLVLLVTFAVLFFFPDLVP